MEDNRDEVPYPEWMERDPKTGEVPELPGRHAEMAAVIERAEMHDEDQPDDVWVTLSLADPRVGRDE